MNIKLPYPLKQRIKAALNFLRPGNSAAKLERIAKHVTRSQLANELCALGVTYGDALFVHSSMKSLGFVEGGPAAVIGALQDAVGESGTLVLPTYYLPGGSIQATCEMKDYVFDPLIHGTNMGALPAALLATPGVYRSVHPTHSVAALGQHARYLTEAHHRSPSVFGEGSPWQRFVALAQSKVLGLGVSMGPITFYHLVEDMMGTAFPVHVWLDQTYRMPCIDNLGQQCQVPVRAFDPAIVAQRIDQKGRGDLRAYFAAEFAHARLKHDGRLGSTTAWTIDAPAFLNHMMVLARAGITIYSTPAELAARIVPVPLIYPKAIL